MRQLIVILLFTILLLGTFGAPSCKQQGKVLDIVQAARTFATANVALGVTDEIADILTQDKTLSADQARALFKLSERVLASLDRVRDSINAGVWDTKEIDKILDSALAEVAKFETEIGIKNPQSAARFREYIALLRYGIAAASQIVKNLHPPSAPITPSVEADSRRDPNAQNLTANQLTQIIGVSTIAALKILNIRTADAQTAWRLASDESKTIHAANKLRLQ